MSAQNTGAKIGEMSKVATELAAPYNEYSPYLASHKAARFKSSGSLVQVIDVRVLVDAVASGDANVLELDLEALLNGGVFNAFSEKVQSPEAHGNNLQSDISTLEVRNRSLEERLHAIEKTCTWRVIQNWHRAKRVSQIDMGRMK